VEMGFRHIRVGQFLRVYGLRPTFGLV
jgi:hypothetical protein